MLRLYLQHPKTGLTVECPRTAEGSDPPLRFVQWPLEKAVKGLADQVACRMKKSVMEILMNETDFQIIAKWEPKS
jgi:hypothetical protein